MFGDKEAYLEKRRTAAKTRSKDQQNLGPEFFIRENTKPLFNSNDILTVHNLYSYHCLLCKILNFHTPIALYILFTLSRHKETLIFSSNLQFESFASRASFLWNTFKGLPD